MILYRESSRGIITFFLLSSPTSITFRGVHFREIRPTSSKGGGKEHFPGVIKVPSQPQPPSDNGCSKGGKSGDLLLSVLSSPIWLRTKRPLVIIVPSFSPLRSIIWTLEEEEEEEERAEMEREDRSDRVPSFSILGCPGDFSLFFVGLPSTTTTPCFAFCVPSPPDFLPRPAVPPFVGKKENFLGI